MYQARSWFFHIGASIDGSIKAVVRGCPMSVVAENGGSAFQHRSAHLVRPFRKNEGVVLIVTNSHRGHV